MSSDISRVYAFLAKQGDWVNEADKNGDGAVIKSEFRDFMEENFEWNGEESSDSAKNDLINSFWNSIDTNQSGKISGTNLKNKNALDKKEIASMESRIEMYEILNDFTSTLSAPSVVSDSNGWKKSVSEGLAALVEPYIKNGGKAEDLLAYLQEQAPAIEKKATADYCANEYLNSEMKDFVKQYGYSYAEDNTLQNILDTYIQNIPEDTDFETIKDTVINIIDAYLATAGLKEDNAFDLSQYGYSPTDNSALNDLQKGIIKKNLETKLAELKNDENYEKYSELYDSAINSYIENIIAEAKFGDFNTIKNYGIEEFKTSDEYKNLNSAITVSEFFSSDDYKKAVKDNFSEDFAERVTNIIPEEIDSYAALIQEAVSKAQNGDFNDQNGNLNIDKLKDWVISELKDILEDFYKGGMDECSIEDLNSIYNTRIDAAGDNVDAIKQAALDYCEAISKKGTEYENAVKEVFGDNYEKAIKEDLYSYQIKNKIEELKEKVADIVDISGLTLDNSTWNSLTNNTTIAIGETRTYNITPKFVDSTGKTVAVNQPIEYVSSDTSVAKIDNNGRLIVKSSEGGYKSVTIDILVDGKKIGSKTVTFNFTQDTKIDFSAAGYTQHPEKSIADGTLSGTGSEFQLDLPNNLPAGITAITNEINNLYNAIIASNPGIDTNALGIARDKLIELYSLAVETLYTQTAMESRVKRGSGRSINIQYEGTTYSVQNAQDDDGKEFKTSSRNQSASNNELGLWLWVKTDRQAFGLRLNTQCLMDMFQRFYEQAL